MEIADVEELSFTCRTCLSESSVESEFIDLDSFMLPSLTYIDCLNFCTKLEATTSGDYPIHLCIDCCKSLEICFDFITKSQHADSILRTNIPVKSEPNESQLDEIEMKIDPVDKGFHQQYNSVLEPKSEDEETSFEGFDEAENEEKCEKLQSSEENRSNIENHEQMTPGENHSQEKHESSNNFVKEESPIIDEDFASKEENYRKQQQKIVADDLGDQGKDCSPELNCSNNNVKKSWRCKICSKILRNRVLYEVHVNKHLGVFPYHCSLCSYKCRYKNSLRVHYTGKHKIEPGSEHLQEKFPFNDIADGFVKKENRLLNNNNKTDIDDREDLDSTTMKWKQRCAKIYKCEECEKKFRSRLLQEQHIKNIHPNGKQYNAKAMCTICRKEYRVLAMLTHQRNHIRQLRRIKQRNERKQDPFAKPLEKPFLCSLCPKQFQANYRLRMHEENCHSQSKEKKFECDQCSSKFANKFYLKQHKKSVHIPAKHKCELCGRLFKLQFQLRDHLKRHSQRIHQCDHCEKSYSQPVELRIHMRTHTGEKPYHCTMCDESFRLPTRLKHHMAFNHTGETTKCPHCSKEFLGVKSSKYYIHLYKHIGMPYKCEVCHSEYDTRSHMRRHMKSAHAIEMSDMELIVMFRKNMGRYATRDMRLIDGKLNEEKTATGNAEEEIVEI